MSSGHRGSWHFVRRRPSSGKARNSQVEKFFRSEESEDKTNSVIREGIQNSLDAAVVPPGEKARRVNIIVTFGEVDAKSTESIFGGLFDHLNAVELEDSPAPDEPVRFLAFEDFNTSGLVGNTREWDPADNKNAFFNFFRGEGVTEKTGNQRGRHGVGKMVFSIASRARSIFGVTATQSRGPVLMGASTLALHKLGKDSYDPDGWFGMKVKIDGDELVVPIEDEKTIGQFASSFSLERDDIPGLSVVVPWLHESVTPEKALHAVLKGFYWPILANQLHVEIRVHGREPLQVSADSISSIAATADCGVDAKGRAEILAVLKMAKWAQSQTGVVRLEAPGGNAPKWNGKLISADKREALRQQLDQEQPIVLDVPVSIRRKGAKQQGELSSFRVFLEPDEECTEGEIHFIREGLVISAVKCRRIPARYRALVVIDDGPLAEFLGDAENPSHTLWEASSVREKYSYHNASLTFVVQAVPEILAELYSQEKSADATLLVDLFALPAKEESLPDKPLPGRKKKKADENSPPKLEIKKAKPKVYDLSQRSDGFVVRRGENGAARPKAVTIRAAYAVRKGRPLKKYTPDDFDFSSKSLAFEVTGGTIEFRDKNELKVAVTDDDFRISASGFDQHRDLFVDVKVEKEDTEDEAADEVEHAENA